MAAAAASLEGSAQSLYETVKRDVYLLASNATRIAKAYRSIYGDQLDTEAYQTMVSSWCQARANNREWNMVCPKSDLRSIAARVDCLLRVGTMVVKEAIEELRRKHSLDTTEMFLYMEPLGILETELHLGRRASGPEE